MAFDVDAAIRAKPDTPHVQSRAIARPVSRLPQPGNDAWRDVLPGRLIQGMCGVRSCRPSRSLATAASAWCVCAAKWSGAMAARHASSVEQIVTMLLGMNPPLRQEARIQVRDFPRRLSLAGLAFTLPRRWRQLFPIKANQS
jgi:hypothetical protein